MSELRLLLLGPPMVLRDGEPVSLSRAKATALLAYLAHTGERHSRTALTALLWPEQEPDRGLAALRNTLWRLNQVLGEGWLVADRLMVQFQARPGSSVDSTLFLQLAEPSRAAASPAAAAPAPALLERLAEAAALHRGAFLQGLSLTDCPEFDDWQRAQSAHLRRRLLETLEALIQGALALGRMDQALAHAQRLTLLEPFDERAWRHLMQLCAWRGQRAQALKHYERCVAVLRQELGQRPEAETVALAEAIGSGQLPEPPRPPSPPAPAPAPAAPEPAAVPLALPVPTTPFIGRERELAGIARQLDTPGCRLLVLVGPGGVGKTRLALETARRRQGAYQEGVCFVPLAPVTSPEGLPSAMASALGLTPTGAVPLHTRLVEHLRSRQMLLVLDEFENLLEGAALLSEMLGLMPRVQVLVTSRRRLNLLDEWEWVVGSMACPAEADPAPEAWDAVALFTQTARRRVPSFSLDARTLPEVVRLCRTLGGLPLALELAAAAVRHETPAEIAARVERGVDLLEAPRGVPERQRSLRALFLHAQGQLPAQAQQVLRQLAVFRGGWTQEAGEAVAQATLPLARLLVDAFLVERTPGRRYALHGLIHHFALERLQGEAGEEHATRERHADFFTGLVERWARQQGRWQPAALEQLQGEAENIRGAWEWAVEQGRLELVERALEGWARLQQGLGDFQPAESSLRRAVGRVRQALRGEAWAPEHRLLLGRLLSWQGRFALELEPPAAAAPLQEATALLGGLEAHAELGLALEAAGRLALTQGAHAAAEWCLRGCLALGRAQGDRHLVATALTHLAAVASGRGEEEVAARLLREGLALFRMLGDRRQEAAGLGGLGQVLVRQGALEQAEQVYREALRLREGLGEPHLRAALLESLARVRGLRGDVAEARLGYQECLELGRALAHPERVAAALHGLGWVSHLQGQHGEARAWLEQGLEIRRRLNARQGLLESLSLLAQVALAQGDRVCASSCLRSALESALEIDSVAPVLESLVGLVALEPRPSWPSLRALTWIAMHPAAEPGTRERAHALLGDRASLPGGDSNPPPLAALIADVLG